MNLDHLGSSVRLIRFLKVIRFRELPGCTLAGSVHGGLRRLLHDFVSGRGVKRLFFFVKFHVVKFFYFII